MTVLVTGGAGYIGSHTVKALRAAGRKVVVLDNFELGSAEAVLGAPLVRGDIADRELVSELCAQHDVRQLIHFAAYKNVGESMLEPAKYWRNNVAGTVELVEAMLAADVHRIVFSSSCSVNGTPASVPLAEDAPIAPESVYAETKAMVERILGWYGITHGVRAASLRYFNAAGASTDGVIGEDWTHSQNLIPLVMKATLGKRPPVRVFGSDYPTADGTCVRDYIHIEDLADAHVRALRYLRDGGDTVSLNVGSGVGSSVLDIIHATERISGQVVPYEVGPRRAGDPVVTYADPTKVHTTLGWSATRSLDEIIESAWRWHSTHLDGFAD